MKPLLLTLPGSRQLESPFRRALGAETGALTARRFPDGESYIRLDTCPEGRAVVVLASMDRPDPKVLPLLLVLETARELGARSVGLVAPYLCYLRQDRRFRDGEAVSARVFPRVLCNSLDWITTVDPHLHRIASLSDVYPIPNRVVHAAPAIASWVAANVSQPLIVGPDSESKQWVADVARRAGVPYVVLEKQRRGDRDVEIHVPDVARWSAHTPVLVDDIISTGRTMSETIGHLRRAGLRAPFCIGVHALFAEGALEELRAAGAEAVVTCDTVPHDTNEIELAPGLARATRDLLESADHG